MNEFTDAKDSDVMDSKDLNVMDSKDLDLLNINVALQDMVIRGLYGRGKNQPYPESMIVKSFETVTFESFEPSIENTTIDTKKRKFIDIS